MWTGPMAEPILGAYDALDNDQWQAACDALCRDIDSDKSGGVRFLALAGQEPAVFFELETKGMIWRCQDFSAVRPLSELIIADNGLDSASGVLELEAMLTGLGLTYIKLCEHLKKLRGDT